jgi:hypothetical protein
MLKMTSIIKNIKKVHSNTTNNTTNNSTYDYTFYAFQKSVLDIVSKTKCKYYEKYMLINSTWIMFIMMTEGLSYVQRWLRGYPKSIKVSKTSFNKFMLAMIFNKLTPEQCIYAVSKMKWIDIFDYTNIHCTKKDYALYYKNWADSSYIQPKKEKGRYSHFDRDITKCVYNTDNIHTNLHYVLWSYYNMTTRIMYNLVRSNIMSDYSLFETFYVIVGLNAYYTLHESKRNITSKYTNKHYTNAMRQMIVNILGIDTTRHSFDEIKNQVDNYIFGDLTQEEFYVD